MLTGTPNANSTIEGGVEGVVKIEGEAEEEEGIEAMAPVIKGAVVRATWEGESGGKWNILELALAYLPEDLRRVSLGIVTQRSTGSNTYVPDSFQTLSHLHNAVC